MATIQDFTTKGNQLEIFGSLSKSALTETWWQSHKGAIVFPTDENKVYFAGVAYDGMSSEQLENILNTTYGITPSANHTTPTTDPTKTNGYYTVAEIKYLLGKYQTVLTQAANAGKGISIDTVNGVVKISVNITEGTGIKIVDDATANSTKKTISLDTANNVNFRTAINNNTTSSDESIEIGTEGSKTNLKTKLAEGGGLVVNGGLAIDPEYTQEINANIEKATQLALNLDGDDIISVENKTDESGNVTGKKISFPSDGNSAFAKSLHNHTTAGTGIEITHTEGDDSIEISVDTTTIQKKLTPTAPITVNDDGKISISTSKAFKIENNTVTLNTTPNAPYKDAFLGNIEAGDGISIAESSSGKLKISSNLDLSLYEVVTDLPTSDIKTNKIYLVANAAAGTNNSYKEYVYVNGSWELLGEYKAELDLTPYLKKEDAEDIYLKSANISGVSAEDNHGTQVTIMTTPDGSSNAEKVQVSAAIIIQ